MPQPIADNTLGTPISGSIVTRYQALAVEGSERDFAGGYFGLDWYSSITPQDGRYVIISQSVGAGVPTHWITADSTDAELLYTVNRLPSVANQQTFTTTASALDYLVQNDYTVLRNTPGNTDADDLEINLDAKIISSYPQTSSTWYDISGERRHATLYNGIGFDVSKGGIETDGSDDFIGVPYYELTGSTTIEIGFKSPSDLGPEQSLVNFRNNSSNYNGYGSTINFTSTSPNTIGFRFVLNSVPYYNAGWPIVADTNYLLQAIVDWDAGQIGYLKLNLQDVSNSASGRVTDGHTLMARNSTSYFFQGLIYHYKVYGRALSLSELEQNYYGGPIVTDDLVFAVDPSNPVSYENGTTNTYQLTGSVNSGSLANGTGFSLDNGGCWSFDGADDYIEFGAINSSNPMSFFGINNMTIEAWVYPVPSGDPYQRYIDKSDGGNGQNGWTLFLGDSPPSTKRIGFAINSTYPINVYGNVYEHNAWNHIVITRDGNDFNMYSNGEIVSSSTVAIGFPSTTTNMRIGSWNHTGGREWNGKIGPIRAYHRTLSTEEVLQNYNAQKQKYQS